MHPILLLVLAVALVAALQFVLVRSRAQKSGDFFSLANIGSGTHENAKSYWADAAVTTRYLLAKIGTDAEHAAICGAGDIPIGVFTDEVATADIAKVPIAVELLGVSNRTQLMIPSEALSAGEEVFTAADGKIQDLPVSAGTFYSVGYTLEVGAQDVPCEVLPHSPRKLVVE